MVSHYFILAFRALVILLLPRPPASYSATLPSPFYPYRLSFSSSEALSSFPPQHPGLAALSSWNAFAPLFTWPALLLLRKLGKLRQFLREAVLALPDERVRPFLHALIDSSYFSLQHGCFFVSFMFRKSPSLD